MSKKQRVPDEKAIVVPWNDLCGCRGCKEHKQQLTKSGVFEVIINDIEGMPYWWSCHTDDSRLSHDVAREALQQSTLFSADLCGLVIGYIETFDYDVFPKFRIQDKSIEQQLESARFIRWYLRRAGIDGTDKDAVVKNEYQWGNLGLPTCGFVIFTDSDRRNIQLARQKFVSGEPDTQLDAFVLHVAPPAKTDHV